MLFWFKCFFRISEYGFVKLNKSEIKGSNLKFVGFSI
jgi:hypothetical protein